MKTGTRVAINGWPRVGTVVKNHNGVQVDVEWDAYGKLAGFVETLWVHGMVIVD